MDTIATVTRAAVSAPHDDDSHEEVATPSGVTPTVDQANDAGEGAAIIVVCLLVTIIMITIWSANK